MLFQVSCINGHLAVTLVNRFRQLSVRHRLTSSPVFLANSRLRKMVLISWENDLPSSSPVVPGIARAAILATMSALRLGLAEPLIECRLRDYQMIPLGRSVHPPRY
jgi:hypothetical protein